ncbi:MAG: tetratricopeptide repeat protein, partial [Chloroflexi bacterium]|nr:tetratricopeptide repeat protein [Chloroflexota bacterium]
LRRHQARYAEAVDAIQQALTFEESVSSRYYLGLCQFLGGDLTGARDTLTTVIDNPELLRQGQVMGAYILGQAAEASGDPAAARVWYDRMAEGAPKIIPVLQEESRRHKQTPYGEAIKDHARQMEQIIARRPLDAGRNT